MKEELLINKYLAWMTLFSDLSPLSLLMLKKTQKGETFISSYIPLVDKTICATNKDEAAAFQMFFETFDKTIKEYTRDKADIKKRFNDQVKKTSFEKYTDELEKENEKLLSDLDDLEKELFEEGRTEEA